MIIYNFSGSSVSRHIAKLPIVDIVCAEMIAVACRQRAAKISLSYIGNYSEYIVPEISRTRKCINYFG